MTSCFMWEIVQIMTFHNKQQNQGESMYLTLGTKEGKHLVLYVDSMEPMTDITI